MNDIFINSMRVGAMFDDMDITDIIVLNYIEKWYGTVHCASFCKAVLDRCNTDNICIRDSFNDLYSTVIYNHKCNNKLENIIEVKDHGYDDYARGFLAGQILGFPDSYTLAIVETAEAVWNADDSVGYYQEVLNMFK